MKDSKYLGAWALFYGDNEVGITRHPMEQGNKILEAYSIFATKEEAEFALFRHSKMIAGETTWFVAQVDLAFEKNRPTDL